MTLPQLPGPEENTIHVSRQGQNLGAMNASSIVDKFSAGELTVNDSFWFAPMTEWATFSAHPEFLTHYSASPPGMMPPLCPAPPVPVHGSVRVERRPPGPCCRRSDGIRRRLVLRF